MAFDRNSGMAGRQTYIGHIKLAGVTFDGRQDIIRELNGDEIVIFKPEPDNQYDQFAVAVLLTDGTHLGYIPKEYNQKFFEDITQNRGVYKAKISQITGGGFDTSYGVNIEYIYEEKQ